ncbi:DMT family transporter [Halalkalibacterium halodurans]|uniref:DMT family transporter n=1 Tax=Halalkalibacterium halodurans TaxID=86665 RepID=UPI0009FF7C29|nr:DMT family transporter [Halalkalibacterium halodurans]MDY7222733.1 DMT family transporter [Halalkalibacterium halodurans]MDY7241954.1 DMT family transporter [Halalkalibacterium halodurans]MED4082781.1 DMT family transporter [Halalkalibacterium halodurans]MED4087249.1 DMT family transporter [Halalkalibacterium halodurans]MED4105734.1 DMT family transporter [Halalkalibacterium halodurans]
MKYGFLPFTLYTIISGSLWMLFFAPGLWMSIQTADISHTMVVVYLGLFPTVVPYFAIAYVTMKAGASEATIILYITPVLAMVLSWLWLHEIPGYVSVVGGILTLTGVLFATSDMHKGDRKKPSKKTSVTL